jgi:hypothetical protein
MTESRKVIAGWRGPVKFDKPTKSGRALNNLLLKGGREAEALFEAVHFTQLYAYCAGRQKPTMERAALIAKLTKGKVPLNGWLSAESRA